MKIDALRLQIAAMSELLRLLKQDLRKAEAEEDAPPPKPPKAVQSELPAMPPVPPSPPRVKSRQEELYAKFQTDRRDTLELTLQADFVEDETHGPAFINVALSKILTACGDSPVIVGDLFEFFWLDPWAASLKPPFPFKAFASDKIWPRLLKTMRDEGKAPR